jgi:DNA-binding NarL/FixJ family response regulator
VTIRVVVVDDQQLVRAGFAAILDARDDIEVVGEAADGREAVGLVSQYAPDVVLMDLRMPTMDGVAATREITSLFPATRVLVLTTYDTDDEVFAALRAGASGYLLKDVDRHTLLDAVRATARGDNSLAPSVARRLVDHVVAHPDVGVRPPSLTALSPREVEVLQLVAAGLSNVEIAERLVVSETTVKTHVGSILTKLDLRNRVQAVVVAYEAGLVRPGQS